LNKLKEQIFIAYTNGNMTSTIDDEWSKFIANQTGTGFNNIVTNNYCMQPQQPIINSHNNNINKTNTTVLYDSFDVTDETAPICDDLYISTTTKVMFLNQSIDINNIFWNIPIIEYWKPEPGILKKQIKIVSNTIEEYNEYKSKLQNINYYNENIIKQINNPSARRLKFKDERKITIGLSKKDIMNCRGKIKNAFYNCFAIIMRFKYEGVFREMHVKVFNTGKMEIPGVINEDILSMVKQKIIDLIQPFIKGKLEYIQTTEESNVLINSNFNCGFFLNRDVLYSILRSPKYGIETSYDPCSYPGIKCKFYFNNKIGFDTKLQNGQILGEDRGMKMSEVSENKIYTEVSFMIFRTGSCLIVGNCSEPILQFVFNFIKNLLTTEYTRIRVLSNEVSSKPKRSKLRKRTVWFVE